MKFFLKSEALLLKCSLNILSPLKRELPNLRFKIHTLLNKITQLIVFIHTQAHTHIPHHKLLLSVYVISKSNQTTNEIICNYKWPSFKGLEYSYIPSFFP
jgi:hypothetical protein